jgi:hypothetical protein
MPFYGHDGSSAFLLDFANLISKSRVEGSHAFYSALLCNQGGVYHQSLSILHEKELKILDIA